MNKAEGPRGVTDQKNKWSYVVNVFVRPLFRFSYSILSISLLKTLNTLHKQELLPCELLDASKPIDMKKVASLFTY